MSDAHPAMITDLATASRYLIELCAAMPFDEAVSRVRSRADAKTGAELDALQRYLRGETATKPARELSLYADFLKAVPDPARAAAGVRAFNESLADAHALADATRAGLPAELSYSALLLFLGAATAGLWLVYLAPEFTAMLRSFGASLPPLSRAIANTPWLIFAPIAVLAAALAAIARAGYRQAAAIETLAPLEDGWVKRLVGARAARAHERWRLATLASARIQAGVPFADAIRAPSAAPHADAGAELERHLRVAAELGLAAHEIEHQRRRSVAEYRGAIELERMVSMRVLQITIAAVVGAIVIAIYQPIFRMGAVI